RHHILHLPNSTIIPQRVSSQPTSARCHPAFTIDIFKPPPCHTTGISTSAEKIILNRLSGLQIQDDHPWRCIFILRVQYLKNEITPVIRTSAEHLTPRNLIGPHLSPGLSRKSNDSIIQNRTNTPSHREQPYTIRIVAFRNLPAPRNLTHRSRVFQVLNRLPLLLLRPSEPLTHLFGHRAGRQQENNHSSHRDRRLHNTSLNT